MGSEKTKPRLWVSVIRQLIHLGLIKQNIVNNSALQLTEEARPVLRSEVKLELATPRLTFSASAYSQKQTTARYDKDLFARLRFLTQTDCRQREHSALRRCSTMRLSKKWHNSHQPQKRRC